MRELLSTNKKLTLLFSSGLCSEQPCNKHRDVSRNVSGCLSKQHYFHNIEQ